MNRRIRNRTYGGVGGRRGISPASYPILIRCKSLSVSILALIY